MKRQRSSLLVVTAVVLLATTAFVPHANAQSKAPAAQSKAAPPAPAAQPAAAPARLAPPVRGEAELGYTKPVSKRSPDGKFVVTSIKVKNLSQGSIAGLKVDEYWYDKAGDPVTGDTFRYRKPLQPGEVIEVQLRTPVNPKMDRNQYKFEHANGTIKTKSVPKL
jgi:hypothetical protein